MSSRTGPTPSRAAPDGPSPPRPSRDLRVWPLVAFAASFGLGWAYAHTTGMGARGLLLAGALGVAGGLAAVVLELFPALRRARAELARVEANAAAVAARDQAFFERLSQEFRTPLTLIVAGFRALEEEREAPLKVRREVAAAGLRNTARLLLVLHELGALASAAPGQRAPRKRVVDLAALVSRVAANFSASGAGRRLELRGLDAAVAVDLDPHQIQTVLYAVLSNAFQRADPVSGTITVSLEPAADAVTLCVRDDGGRPGPEAVAESAVTGGGAPGLGLAVVREIVSAHQGELEVQGDASGLTVRVRLPRGEAREAPRPFLDESTEVLDFLHRLARAPLPTDEPEAEGPLDPSRPLLLVVAGNPDLRGWIRRVLSARYAVATAADLDAARERAATLRPALLVVDADPPDPQSVSLVAELRRDPVLCATPVIGLLGRAVGLGAADPDGLAADDYLPLPFEAEELLARVNNLVRCRVQADELASLRRQLEARAEDQVKELVRSGQIRRFLPQALLEGALRRPAEAEDEEDESPPYERRWITVVYCALHGFGELAERMEPADLARLLNAWSREAAAEATSRGGVVDQHFGDALLLVFGAPEARRPSEQAAAAIDAALAIQARTAALAQHWHRYGLPRELDLRTGVHTGVALTGVLGSELTARWTAFGPAVQVATRLAAAPENPGLLVSLATYAHVRAAVEVVQTAAVEVEGLSRPVEAYTVRGWKGGARPAPTEAPP